MPRRVRRDLRRRVELTPRRTAALVVGPDPSGDEPDELLVQVYAEHRERLLAEVGPELLWAFWRFEPDVPEELRAERPALARLADDEPDEQDPRVALAALTARRAAWLAAEAVR